MPRRLGFVAATILVFLPSIAAGEETELELGPLTPLRIVEIAATVSPATRLAAARLHEARARKAAAGALADNPSVESVTEVSDLGAEQERRTELELTIPFGIGLERPKRRAEARASLRRDEHLVAWERDLAIGEALGAYYRALHAEAHRAAAQDRSAVADELWRVASERHRAGDISRLEEVVVEVERSRARSETLAANARVAAARRDLALVLGVASGSALVLEGDLGDRSVCEVVLSAPPAGARADVEAARNELVASDSESAAWSRSVLPDLALRLNAEHTRSEDAVFLGAEITLPLFDRAQAERGAATARRARAAIELARRTDAARAEREATGLAYQDALASLREIEEIALPNALEAESLARQGYEAGKLDLASLLVIRSGTLETRREHIDRMLEAALAGIDAALASGGFQTKKGRVP
jgi:cobalt-zinc-cadmium efflux system outer membrane protein